MAHKSLELIAHVDGGARGNPGPAAAAFVLRDADDQAVLMEKAIYLGETTNNVAEYKALLAAMEAASALGAAKLEVRSDSELLVRQLSGQYRVKSKNLQPLFAEAIRKKKQFGTFSVNHIRREQNTEADRLVNMAIDAAGDIE